MLSPDPRISRACAAFATAGVLAAGDALAGGGALRACTVFATAGVLAAGGATAAGTTLRAWTVSRALEATGVAITSVASAIHVHVRNGLAQVKRYFGMYPIANLIQKFPLDAQGSCRRLIARGATTIFQQPFAHLEFPSRACLPLPAMRFEEQDSPGRFMRNFQS
jgi:hypothetical protein